MTYEQIAQEVDRLLKALQQIILSFLTRLGVFGVALMPAAFTGYSIYVIFEYSEIGKWFGILTAFALEVAGILGIHTASDLYTGKSRARFHLMLGLLPIYILSIVGIVYFSDGAFHPLVRSIGMASPFLTGVTYVAIALRGKNESEQAQATKDEAEKKQKIAKVEEEQRLHQEQVEAQDRAWQQERERLELELKHQEKLARIAAKNRPAEPSSNVHKTVSKDEVLEGILGYVGQNPDASLSSIGRYVGRPKSTIGLYVTELTKAGRLHRNGHGWEVKQ